MHYLDTSFIAPLLLQEASSTRVEAKLAAMEPGSLWISQWTRVEFASLIAREVRMGGLLTEQADTALLQFDTLVSESFRVLQPATADFELAKLYIQNYKSKLRAGDALHLAIAHNHRATMFHTLDKALLAAARLFKIKAGSL